MKLGIDFGTCFSYAAICDNIRRLTPLIGYDDEIRRDKYGIPTAFFKEMLGMQREIIGEKAYELITSGGGATGRGTSNIKGRLLGKKFSPEIYEKNLEYGGVRYSIRDITAKILQFIIENAVYTFAFDYPGANRELEKLVIAIPSSLNSYSYRTFIKDCLNEAIRLINLIRTEKGYEKRKDELGEEFANIINSSSFDIINIELIYEPVAAALSYIWNNENELNAISRILVYDLGGGTFDTTIVEYDKHNSEQKFKVLAQRGIGIGGNDWDNELYKYILKLNNIDRIPHRDVADFMQSVIKAKIELTDNDYVDFEKNVNSIPGPPIKADLYQTKFEEITKDLLEETIAEMRKVIADFNKKCGRDEKIDLIVLSGGASKMPMVENRINDLIKECIPDCEVKHIIDFEKAVAFGAAIYAVDPYDAGYVAPSSYGIEILYSQRWEIEKQRAVEHSNRVLRKYPIYRGLYGDEVTKIKALIFKNDKIYNNAEYIIAKEKILINKDGWANIVIYELPNLLKNKNFLLPKDNAIQLFQFNNLYVNEMPGKEMGERSISVELRLYKGGLLGIHVFDNDYEYEMAYYAIDV